MKVIAIDPEIERLVIESNHEFDKIVDIDTYLEEKEAEWHSYAGKENPLFNEMVKNPMSQRLEFFREQFTDVVGVDVFPELLIANKYGATIAENNRLTDWDQSDRLQFQNSRDYGFHVSDLYYDKSAGVWALEVAVAIKSEGKFAGIVKVAYNIQDIIDIFLDSTEESPYDTANFALFSGNNLAIHDEQGAYNLGDDASDILGFFDIKNLKEGTFFGEDFRTSKTVIVSFSTSDGFRDYSGLNWVVGGSIDETEFLADVNQLQNVLIGIMVISIIVGAGIGVGMTRGIVSPIKKMEKAAKEISNENFDEKVEIKNKDEFGSLAKSMNEMAQKLKNAQKEKEEFVAMITHDLKQPLVPISGNAEMLSNPKMGELNEMQKECVDEIAANASRQLSMIDNLVSAQKLGAGAMEFDTEELSSKDLLKNCIKTHSPIMADKHIEYFDSSIEDIKIIGDKRRILESFTKIIQNAHDFVPDKGKIEIGVNDGEKEVTFFVKDNGEGIPKEKQDKLFKKYGQVESKAKRKFGGTGLGLAVSQELVNGMGGKIWLESEVGKGTTFFFTIPKAE